MEYNIYNRGFNLNDNNRISDSARRIITVSEEEMPQFTRNQVSDPTYNPQTRTNEFRLEVDNSEYHSFNPLNVNVRKIEYSDKQFRRQEMFRKFKRMMTNKGLLALIGINLHFFKIKNNVNVYSNKTGVPA